MNKEQEYIIEDLIKSADKLIQDIPIEDLELEKSSESQKKIETEVQKEEIESLGLDAQPIIDGFVEFRISNDDMEVTGNFYPQSENGHPIEEEDVRDKLKSFGVVFGIDWKTIKEKIKQCNKNHLQMRCTTPVRSCIHKNMISNRSIDKPQRKTDYDNNHRSKISGPDNFRFPNRQTADQYFN